MADHIEKAIVIFAICVVVAHIIMFSVRRNKRFWVAIDYLVILMAAVALLNLTANARNIIRKELARISKENMPYSVENAKYAINHLAVLLKENVGEPDINDYVHHAWHVLARQPDQNQLRVLIGALPKLEDTNDFSLRGGYDYLVRAFSTIESHLDDIDTSEQELGHTNIDKVATVLSPLLFSLSLALLIAKVTAKQLGYTD